MKPPIQTILWTVAGVYALVRGLQELRSPTSTLPWVGRYALILVAGLFFSSAFETFRTRHASAEPQAAAAPVRLTRLERITFRTLGAIVTAVGLGVLGIGCMLGWDLWVKVTRWPSTNAVLVSRENLTGGANLVFRYQVGGRSYAGEAYRWGSDTALYEPGTVHQIKYDPDDPAEIQTVGSYNWELFRAPIPALVIGLVLIAGGAVVFRWSYGWKSASG